MTHGHINAFTADYFDYLKGRGWGVYHSRILCSRLKYIRKIIDADRLYVFNDSPMKTFSKRVFNFLVPLLRLLIGRYVVGLSFRLDSLLATLSCEYDAHLFLLVREQYAKDRPCGKSISALDLLGYSVPLFHIGTKAAVKGGGDVAQ